MPGPANPKIPTLALREKILAVPQILTINGSAIAVWDVSYFYNAHVLCTANFTMPLPTGLYPGAGGMISFKQDSTGSRVITWASGYKAAGGTKPVLTTTATTGYDEIAWYSRDGINVTLSPVSNIS